MIRNKIFRSFPSEPFLHRGNELYRVEALSDAVFAFSVSLLVASLEVPQTFEELMIIVRGAIPFFATVALLFLLWYQQYIFFRRYGINDFKTILLNLLYLAIVLFYVYPLKFLFSVLISSWTGIDLFPKASIKGLNVLTNHDFPQLIILFSIGYFCIWFLIYLMHKHALSYSKKLSFNHYEYHFSQFEKRGAIWNAIIGLIAIIPAWAGKPWLSGIVYLLIPVILLVNKQVLHWQLNRSTP